MIESVGCRPSSTSMLMASERPVLMKRSTVLPGPVRTVTKLESWRRAVDHARLENPLYRRARATPALAGKPGRRDGPRDTRRRVFFEKDRDRLSLVPPVQ